VEAGTREGAEVYVVMRLELTSISAYAQGATRMVKGIVRIEMQDIIVVPQFVKHSNSP